MSVPEGRVALVTGASRGVGAGIADVPADEGAVVNYLGAIPKILRTSGHAG